MQYPTIAQPQYAFAPTMMAEGGLVDAARAVQSKGRGEDTMLVHMTPGEVGGLQALAMSQGGSLSTNPNTGLPEAGFLKNLLPTLIGVALTPFMGPVGAAMTVGGIETARTGDLGKGIMAGLGAYGGAQMGASLGNVAPTPTPNVMPTAPAAPPPDFGTSAYQAAAMDTGAQIASTAGTTGATGTTGQGIIENLPKNIASSSSRPTYEQMGLGFKEFMAKPEDAFGRFVGTAETKTAPKTGLGGPMGALKTAGLAAAPILTATPEYAAPAQQEEEKYEGPYTPTRRTVSYPGEEQRRRTSEFMYFSPSNPVPFAEGGDVAAPSMSAPEAQVFSQIANVQRLAGLPVIDTSGFNVRSAIPSVEERMGLVYNPIDNTYTNPIGSSGTPLGLSGGAERNYGFESLSSHIPQGGVPRQNTGTGGITFYKRTTPAAPVFSSRYVDPNKDPDAYREQFETYTPSSTPFNLGLFSPYSQRVNMANYAYDPVLGGFIELPGLDSMWGGAKGGSVPELESGGFVLTKKAVDGLGKGDNKKGQEVASRGLGAIPIKGPGTGTSDSIKTTIDGKQPARIANGESYVPRKEVEKRGGAKKFYALMKKAERRA